MKEITHADLLAQMRVLAARAEGTATQRPANGPDFGSLMTEMLNDVNANQKAAGSMIKRFEAGDETVSLSDVMVSMQKSSLAFQATNQVRNRLVSAYQDVMNMPI